MTGVQHLLTALGIKIDPQEIEQAWEKAKDALPKLAVAFETVAKDTQEIKARLSRIDTALNLPPLETTNVPAVLDESRKTTSA